MSEVQRQNPGVQPGRIRIWIRLFVVLATLAILAAARAASFTASLDHDTLVLGDTATLSLRFDGGRPNSGVDLPTVPGLQYLNANSPSVEQVSVNGALTVIYGIAVKPTQDGDFVIPSIIAKLGNESFASQPIKFKVVRPAAPEPGSEAEQQSLALLRYVVPKQEIFMGETIVVEQQLLIRAGVQSVPGLDVPALQVSGCATGRTVQGQQRQTVIGSTTFTVIPFYIPLTAMRPGKLSIGPVEGAVVVELAAQNRQRDPFDPFGMLNRGVQQRVALASPEVVLNVLPLPDQGKPASFSGGVGQFTMTGTAGPTNVAVGDPVTIRLQVSGRGALDSITLPEQPAWKEFKVYPPTVKIETSGDLGLEGTKSFEQVIVPQNTEITAVPALEFTYFDPEKRSYQTLKQPAVPLLVRPSGSISAPTLALSNSKPEVTAPTQDIVHIKAHLGRTVASRAPWVQQPVFIVLQGVPVFALLGAILWRRRQDNMANNPRLRRQLQVEDLVQDGLSELSQLAAERNSDAFFALVFRLLQERIGERLDLPASAITEAVVDDRLIPGGLKVEAAGALHELFRQCNQARYAPVQSLQELEAVIPKLEATLQQVKEVRL